MKIYNSYTKRKEEFIPLEEGKVKMYACGITVSGEAHIGHAYQALIYDIIRKYLFRHLGRVIFLTKEEAEQALQEPAENE